MCLTAIRKFAFPGSVSKILMRWLTICTGGRTAGCMGCKAVPRPVMYAESNFWARRSGATIRRPRHSNCLRKAAEIPGPLILTAKDASLLELILGRLEAFTL